VTDMTGNYRFVLWLFIDILPIAEVS